MLNYNRDYFARVDDLRTQNTKTQTPNEMKPFDVSENSEKCSSQFHTAQGFKLLILPNQQFNNTKSNNLKQEKTEKQEILAF